MTFNSRRPYVVVLPGAWGNQTKAHVDFWCGDVGTTVATRMRGSYHPVTYTGDSIDDIAANAARDLEGLPQGSIVIAYSMGAQVLRAVIPRLPAGTFARIVLVSGLTRFGITIPRFVNIALIATWSFVASLLTGRVTLRSEGDYRRLMGTTIHYDIARRHMHVEPMWMKIAQVFLPGFRKAQPPIPRSIPTFAIIPKDDAIVAFQYYPDEDIQFWQTPGGHDAVMLHSVVATAAAEWVYNTTVRAAAS